MYVISWPSFLAGLIVGLLVGIFVGVVGNRLMTKMQITGADTLAWVMVVIWIVWHVGGGLGYLDNPPTLYDVISGAAVGYILGEKFFTFLKILR